MSNTDKTLELIKNLINEVTEEARAGILKESVQPQPTVEDEQKLLKEYVTRKVVKLIKESGD